LARKAQNNEVIYIGKDYKIGNFEDITVDMDITYGKIEIALSSRIEKMYS
jgi:hypothetical protein